MTISAVAVIPAFNEAGAIGRVIKGLCGIVAHVIVVDDGSTDGTAERAREAGAEVVRHEKNLGKGHAVRRGLALALVADYTHVLLLDADMQHLPQEAPRLLGAAAQTGADVVIGERQFRRADMPASRYHANRIGSQALSWFVDAPVRDSQCGFRVFRTDTLRPLRLHASGYEIETEMLVKVRRRGASITSVPVSAIYAGARSKLRPVRDTTRTCFLAVYYRYLERL
jgi:glycosyltransferase involved in cell wall biosynthesis